MSNRDSLFGAYGFGSFFREEPFKDIDVLLVAKKEVTDCLQEYNASEKILNELGSSIGIDVHVLFLTYEEYLAKPLIEMDNLTTIFEL